MVNGNSSDTKFKYLLDFVTIHLIHVAFSEIIKLSNILPIGFTIRFRQFTPVGFFAKHKLLLIQK